MATIGILALQGDVREHRRALQQVGCESTLVRRPEELAAVDGLILPGGESTTIVRLARAFDLLEPLRAAVGSGLPVYGSCAGMILLADRLANPAVGADGAQETFGGIDMTVRRNAFGRQVDSFETEVDVDGIAGGPLHAVFIRAPWVENVGPGAQPLAWIGPAAGDPPAAAVGRVVVIRQGALLATAFHPELTGDARVHAYFCSMVKEVT